MGKIRLLVLLIFALLSPSTVTGAPIQMPSGWSGQTTFKDDGTFTGCSAEATFNSGVVFYLFVYRNYNLDFAFHNPVWAGAPGKHIDVWLQFEPSPWQRYPAYYFDQTTIYLSVPSNFQDSTTKNLAASTRFHMRFEDFNYDFVPENIVQVLGGLSDCIKNNTPEPSPTASTNKPQNTQSNQGTTEQTATAKTGPSTGTGIIVGGDGYILTNHHVVDNCHSIQFTQEGNSPDRLEIVREDVENDLAILKTDRKFPDGDVAKLRTTPSPRAGEVVAVYGFPFAGILSQSGNIVGGNISSLAGLNDDVRFFQITAPVQPGNSGGPLMDEAANVIGVVNARINDLAVLKATGAMPQNINFSIKANIVTNFLDTHSISYQSAQSTDKLSLSDIGSKAKKFAVLVTCN